MNTQSINFKWNPFTMRGEAPASLRFKQSEDDLEFASKEDLEAIKGDPRLSKIYQAMNAGVTKKFQGWSEERRTLQNQLSNLQQQVTELDSGLSEWENWFADNKEALTKSLSGDRGRSGEDGRDRGKKREEPDERYNQLVEAFNRAGQAFEKRLGHLGRMLQLSMELGDLQRQNPTIDANKILDVALKKGYHRLSDAYKDEDAYGKEILDKEVETRLKPRLEEELLKHKTNVETGSGAVPMRFELPKEAPKSFTDAGQQFLAEREKEGANLGGSEPQKK